MSVFASITELINELTTQDIRLWLDDDQLRFSAPKGGMNEATRDKIVQNKNAIIEFLSLSKNTHIIELKKVDYTQLQPLSYAQERIWFLCQLDPDNTAFHLTSIFSIKGNLDTTLLTQVLNTIIARHDILRTAYVQTETGTYQKILTEKIITLHHQTLPNNLNGNSASTLALQQLSQDAAKKHFNLENGDVTYCQIIEKNPEDFTLIFTLHHIATDGWSMNIIAKEIAILYATLAQEQTVISTENKNSNLTTLPFQYVDFSVWQKEFNQTPYIQQQLAFWKKELADVPNLHLPCDFTRPVISQNKGNSLRFVLDADTTHKLNTIALNNNVTLYMTLLSLFSTFLYRYSQQAFFCIGTPIAGRSNSQFEKMIGCFLNMIAIKTEHLPDESFVQLLAKNRKSIQSALANQDIPFEQVVKEIVTERDLSVTPIFQVLFGLQNMPLEEISTISGIQIKSIETNKQTALYDLSLSMNEWQGNIFAEMDYKEELFSHQTIGAMIENFKRLIHSVIENPQQALNDINILSNDDLEKQCSVWNNTEQLLKAEYHNKGIHHLIEAQAKKTPEAVAIKCNELSFTYSALNAQANQLANFILANLGDSQCPIGVYLERSINLPIALLAILKTGRAYLPLDLSFPEDRLNYIINDVGITVLLSESHLQEWKKPANIHCINLDIKNDTWHSASTINPTIGFSEKNLFNVIYTSGSTGQPKGVMVSHAAILNRLVWMQNTFPLSRENAVLQKTPYGFDVSVWEIFWPLMFGAQLVLASPHGHKNPTYLRDLIIKEKICTLHFVPSMLGIFLQTENIGQCSSLQNVFCSGESLSANLVQEFYQHFPTQCLVNLYGPTEAAIDVSYYICDKNDNVIPIGKAIDNTQLYLLDQKKKLLPIGATGEIYIGGKNLADGYINQPELTNTVFIQNPLMSKDISSKFLLSQKLYKTGDLGRFDQNGNLLFLGRLDEQVKIRGFRIELGEIKAHLIKHPLVRDCLITIKSNNQNDTRIVAYFIAQQESVNPQVLREYLSLFLPNFMVPVSFTELEEWPLTQNGKINYRLLPDPERNNININSYVAPSNPIETKIAEVWCDLLDLEKIGIHDNFFEFGGHSLLATMAIARLQKEFKVSIPLRDIFKDPTIATIAKAIMTAQNHSIYTSTFAKENSRLDDNEEEILL